MLKSGSLEVSFIAKLHILTVFRTLLRYISFQERLRIRKFESFPNKKKKYNTLHSKLLTKMQRMNSLVMSNLNHNLMKPFFRFRFRFSLYSFMLTLMTKNKRRRIRHIFSHLMAILDCFASILLLPT